MNLAVEELFIIIAVSMLFVGIASFFIAQKKATSTKMAVLLGTVFAIVPIVGIIYLAILSQKPNK